MNQSVPKPKRPDAYSLEMIIVLAIITLHDFLLSNTLSIPGALGRIALARLISLDRVASGLEFIVPIAILATMLVLWFTENDQLVHTLAIVYLAWVTIRLTTKVALGLLYSRLTSAKRSGCFTQGYGRIMDREYFAVRGMVLDH